MEDLSENNLQGVMVHKFSCEVCYGNHVIGYADAERKKAAEQAAALVALQTMRSEQDAEEEVSMQMAPMAED